MKALKTQVGTLLRKCDNDDELITALRAALPAETQHDLLASRGMTEQGISHPDTWAKGPAAKAPAQTVGGSEPRRWVI